MSTFNPPADIAQITLAKSSDVNAVKAATGIAFALLPNETKLQRGTVNFSVDTGTANSYVVTLDASITTYTDGLQVVFRPLNSNTDISTINLNGIGVRSIRLTDSNPIQAGDISAGAIIDVRYSTATGFFHLTPNSAIYAHDAGVSADAAAASQSAASTSASNAASSASSAAGSASSANTSATNAATSASSMTASVASCTASQSAAATSATNAATSASGASTSATNAASSATTATTQASNASTSATNAAASATTASTQASNAASSASTATTQATAAGTSATNAATSATAASGSASTASTQATNAASSASSASGSASTATTQASNASTSASAASTSATNAATSATTATTQAGIATTQATNAATSATAAAASYDSFDDRYLGSKTADPSVDNDGNTLLVGALYWNSTSSVMKVWTGSTWTNLNPATGYLALTGGTMTGAITFAAGQTVANLASGSAGTIPYQTASGTTAMLAVGTSGQVLTSAGAAAPTWSTPAAATKTISNKTGAYTIVSGDLGTIINCTSGTFTVSLTAAASLGSGFTCTIWNTSGTGADTITIDPATTETIDGKPTLILKPGEGLAIVCDGTNWQTDDKKPMRVYAENVISSAVRPSLTGIRSVAIGAGTTAFTDSMALGNSATASGDTSFAAGISAIASGVVSLALGASATASGTNTTAIGRNSGNTASQAVTGAGAMALGGSYASGTDSFAAAIGNNTSTYGAKGAYSVAIGFYCSASAPNSVAIGRNCFATATSSVAIGGDSSYGNLAEAAQSVSIGFGVKTVKYGQYGYACGQFANAGDAQYSNMVLRAATTTTTAVVLTSNSSAAGTTNQIILASGQAMAIRGTLIAKQSASGNMAGWTITGIVSNNAGTMAVSGLALTAIGSDSITLGAQPTIAVDNTNKGVTITSGYKAATSIRWVATVNTSEVTY
jgi:hypothetical protein